MMQGFLLIDKPKGLNSFKLVIAARKKFGLKKVGFAGTLDPLASGLMILALGEYTKLLPYIEKADKVYEVRIEFGKTSTTFDSEGEITPHPEFISGSNGSILKQVQEEDIKKILAEKFSGEVTQIPPKFSAIKIAGEKAYDMARKGEEFEMTGRQVTFHDIKILKYAWPFLDLSVHCSSGTYIRSLAHDLGALLEIGGIVVELRRVSIADWKISEAVSLEEMSEENLINAEKFLKKFQLVKLNDEQYKILALGNFINYEDEVGDSMLALYNGEVVGVLEKTKDGDQLKFKKKFNIV